MISTQAQKFDMMKQTRLMFTLGIIVGVFSVCMLPAAISFAVALKLEKFQFRDFISDNITVYVVVIFIVTTNSFWNFFIYIAGEILYSENQ